MKNGGGGSPKFKAGCCDGRHYIVEVVLATAAAAAEAARATP